MKPLLILCSFLTLHTALRSQELYPLKITPFLQKYLSQPGYAYPLSGSRYSFLDLRPWVDEFKTGGQQLIRTDSNLYVFIQNTSRLYKAVSRDSQYIRFQRIDSTLAMFYNIGAYQFSDGEDIYSYGGYGFWKTHGVLRKFNFKQGEWDVVPLDQEIVAQYDPSSLVWYDAVNRQLHVPFQWQVNDGVKKVRQRLGELDENSWILDIPTRKWRKVGVINSLLLNFSYNSNPSVHFESSKGILVESLKQMLQLDYSNNLFNQSGISTITQTMNRNSFVFDLDFLLGDTLFYLNSETGQHDSLFIGDLPVLESGKLMQQNSSVPVIAAAFLVLMVGAVLIYRKGKSNKTMKSDSVQDNPPLPITIEQDKDNSLADAALPEDSAPEPENWVISFNATELDLISLCLDKSAAGGYADIDEINHVLGIKNKNKGLQKKVRSEIFNSINSKFRQAAHTDGVLIQSVRNKNDKRYFDYFIEAGHFSAVRKLLDLAGNG
jgi:hypothetical protein